MTSVFPYFGRKTKVAPFYGSPAYPVVIEPFAGSLGYSLYWQPPVVLGIEKDERVVALWYRMLQLTQVPPPPTVGTITDDLLVKLCSYSEHSLTSGPMTVTSRMIRDWQFVHRRAIAWQPWATPAVFYRSGSYEQAPDIEATWFIDPPYQYANRRGYREGSGKMDYDALARWVRSRRGQVIVCEQAGADWLPFRRFVDIASHRGAASCEVVWTNTPDSPTTQSRSEMRQYKRRRRDRNRTV